MGDLVELMAAPFAACVVLVGIHAYLGLHVIQRKVIFVDLALAQIAALGATFGFLLGISPHDQGAYFFSLAFAIAGAAIFALTRMRHERVPQEAIIGIVYAVALALAILVADRAPEGAEHIKETLVGTVLWVTWPTIGKTASIYALVGVVHVALRRRFMQISFDPGAAYAEGRWVRLWDFIFYVTFALVITSSVAIAGVLLVFTFLVIPAVIAALFASSFPLRLAIGWTVGIAACLLGMTASYRFDLPSGPAVVSSLGFALLLAGLVHFVVRAERKVGALARVLAVVLVIAGLLAAGSVFFTSGTFLHVEHEHDWERDAHDATSAAAVELDGVWARLERDCAGDPACEAARLVGLDGWDVLLSERLGSADAERREAAFAVAAYVDDPRALDLLVAAARRESDNLLRLSAARRLGGRGDRRGLAIAVELLGDDVPPLIRDDAHELLLEHAGRDFGYDPFAGAEANAAAIARWRDWLGSSFSS